MVVDHRPVLVMGAAVALAMVLVMVEIIALMVFPLN